MTGTFKLLGLSALCAAVLALTGCKESDTAQQKGQEALDRLKEQGATLYFQWTTSATGTNTTFDVKVKKGPFVPGAPRGLIDVGMVSIQLQTYGPTVTTSSGMVNVLLLSGGNTIASNTFPFVLSGNVITFQSPAAVNAWIAQFDGVDGFDVTVQGISANAGGGTNTVVATDQVLGAPVSSASFSWVAGGGEISPTPPGNL